MWPVWCEVITTSRIRSHSYVHIHVLFLVLSFVSESRDVSLLPISSPRKKAHASVSGCDGIKRKKKKT